MDPILITLAFLFADMILQRPPGIWTLIALCATMFLRSRSMYFKEIIFFYEWLIIAIVIIFSFTAHHFVLILTFLPTHNLKLLAMQAFLTIMLYPIFIWVFRSMLRFSLYNTLQKQTRKAVQ
jgi:rod shape-determining protein MreD